ncbi:hypothetical protein NDU88_002076 [Pleurodeles waltl]|uniref:Uncharacterized protein n=1 Tax=Pleurodeles waltl TaxID=8319 RepID=A0AAV7UUI8_PLEWA|nr:hypothetical protein NDU88_002076 [Pleurodeles waltl]
MPVGTSCSSALRAAEAAGLVAEMSRLRRRTFHKRPEGIKCENAEHTPFAILFLRFQESTLLELRDAQNKMPQGDEELLEAEMRKAERLAQRRKPTCKSCPRSWQECGIYVQRARETRPRRAEAGLPVKPEAQGVSGSWQARTGPRLGSNRVASWRGARVPRQAC